MKRILITFFISLMSASVSFAGTVTINNALKDDSWTLPFSWSAYSISNYIHPTEITVFVNSIIKKDGISKKADEVTLDCDGLVSKIVPGSSKTCHLDKGHQDKWRTAKIYISNDDYHNGAEGNFIMTNFLEIIKN